MFNIIDSGSGFRADIVSAEDLLLSKIIWIQDFPSNIQMDDIKNLSALDDLDWPYINEWITELKLNTFDLFK